MSHDPIDFSMLAEGPPVEVPHRAPVLRALRDGLHECADIAAHIGASTEGTNVALRRLYRDRLVGRTGRGWNINPVGLAELAAHDQEGRHG